MATTRIEITASKKKSIKIVFYSIGLIGMGIFVLVIADDQQMMPPFLARLIGYLALMLFIPALCYIIYRLFDDSPRIIIDSAGITDNTAATSPGFIPWREIEGFLIKKVYDVPLFGIILKDPENFYKSSNPVSRFYNLLNIRMFKSSHMISIKTLDIDFDDFAKTVKKFHQKFAGH